MSGIIDHFGRHLPRLVECFRQGGGIPRIGLDPAEGTIVSEGDAEAGSAAGEFSVTIPADVTGTLFPGFYELYLAASSDQLAQVTERKVDLEVAP